MESPKRPLSPFLIYRWGVTNTLSIVHRLTGVYLTLGFFFLAGWLLALAGGPDRFASAAAVYGSAWFKLLLAGWAFCFFYHLANGVRHLVWDAGRGFGHGAIKAGGIAVVVFAVVASVFYLGLGML